MLLTRTLTEGGEGRGKGRKEWRRGDADWTGLDWEMVSKGVCVCVIGWDRTGWDRSVVLEGCEVVRGDSG